VVGSEGLAQELASEEFFEEEAGEAARVVAKDTVFLEEIVEDDSEAELLERGKIDGHRFRALRAIAAGHVGRNGLAIRDDPIDHALRDVLLDGAKMISEGVAGGFSGLGHQIGDIDARGFGLGDGGGNFRDHQIRKNAGVERAGAEQNQVSFLDGFDGPGQRTHAPRGKLELLDGRAAGGDARFAMNDAAVFERGDEMHVRKRRGKNPAPNGQHFAADANGFRKISGDVRERGKEKIAEIVADESAARMKTILKQAAEQRLILRESDHAVANVAGRKDAILAAQAAGAAAVISDGNNGSEIGNGPFGGGAAVGAANHMFLKAAEERGKAGAASKGDDAEAGGKSLRFGGTFFHDDIWDRRSGFISRKRI